MDHGSDIHLFAAAREGILQSASIYSQLSLSRLRLSRITAYLEEKIWSLL